MSHRESSARIDDAAALWAARIDARALSAEEEAELMAWLAGDERRVGAFARARAISVYLARARGLQGDSSDT
ncbi:hypothetical protein [Blastomonas sp. UPD001]|jgi:transmembrane sensor|uniref:hypothetical protein n=1 Tax=Blastomonas sp. UPD001 TaxID=2217673 RepID=UPI001300428A|nr:hypothetical protein [Blastomonas sp. UPD001]